MKAHVKNTFFAVEIALLAVFGVSTASASLIPNTATTSIYLNQLYTGEYPPSPASGSPLNSYLTAVLTGTQLGGGPWNDTLTLTSYLTGGSFVSGSGNAKMIGWAFSTSLTGTELDGLASFLSATDSGGNPVNCTGTCAKSITTGSANINTGAVPGSYNLAFYWDANAFADGSAATYTFTGYDPGSFFSATSGYDGQNLVTNLTSVAHIQGYGPANLSCSAFVVNGTAQGVKPSMSNCINNVPEPSELPMMGFGLLLMLAGWTLSRVRKSKN